MSTSTVFQDGYHPLIILAIFSTFVILVFRVSESPFTQPRNLIPGYIGAAFVSMCLTRVLALKLAYRNHLEDMTSFQLNFRNVDLLVPMLFLTHFVLGTGYLM
jgi:hypothetical protein